ncbi:MAG: hypothetical protein QM756_22545 [Polyangiaceae bacterium]
MSKLSAILLAASLLAACGPGGGAYCQSGSRYGTQCYAEPDVRQPPGSYRPGGDPLGRPEEPKPKRPTGTKLPW